MWANSWNKLNQNLSASLPLAVSPTTILFPSINEAPWRKDPFKCGKKTSAIPHSANILFIFGQNSFGFKTVIVLISGIILINSFILIGDVSILRAFIFASCTHASNAKSPFSVTASLLQAILVICLFSNNDNSTTSKYFLRFITFSFESLVSGIHPNLAISL